MPAGLPADRNGGHEMNGTELKTLRQSLFLSVAECAALHQVQERVYRYLEKGEWAIPDDVAARMEQMDDAASYMGALIYDEASVYTLRTISNPAHPIMLIRYSCDADARAMAPLEVRFTDDHRARLPAAVHAAGLDRARQALKENGFKPRMVAMDRDAYGEFLAAQDWSDSLTSRDQWARTQTEPPTRAKKSAHPSGEENLTQASGE